MNLGEGDETTGAVVMVVECKVLVDVLLIFSCLATHCCLRLSRSCLSASCRKPQNTPVTNHIAVLGHMTVMCSLSRSQTTNHSSLWSWNETTLVHQSWALTSLSLSGRNEVSTFGFLPSFFLFFTTGGGAETVKKETQLTPIILWSGLLTRPCDSAA